MPQRCNTVNLRSRAHQIRRATQAALRPATRTAASRTERRPRADPRRPASARLDPMRKLLPELGHLRRDHERAIALLRMLREIILMIGLGRPVVAVERKHLRDDLAVVNALLADFADHLQSGF